MISIRNLWFQERIFATDDFVLNLRNTRGRLDNNVFVINQMIRSFHTAALRITNRCLAHPDRTFLNAFDCPKGSITVETFQLKVRNETSYLRAWVSDPTGRAAGENEKGRDQYAFSYLHHTFSYLNLKAPYCYPCKFANQLNALAMNSNERFLSL